MALNIKPKRFGPVHVRFDGTQTVTFAEGEATEGDANPPRTTPVVTLLASVGHCLMESIRIAARREQAALPAFAVTVTAEKALDLPGRLKNVHCVVTGRVGGNSDAAARIVAEAKSICTVSNTMSCEISVVSAYDG